MLHSQSNHRTVVKAVAAIIFVAMLNTSGVATAAKGGGFTRVYNRAFEAYDRGEYEVALEGFREAYRIRPEPAALLNIARCLHLLHRYEDATDQYEAFLASKPEARLERVARDYLIETLRTVGNSKLLALDFPEAADRFERGVALAPADTTLLLGLAEARLALEQYDAAREAVERAAFHAEEPDERRRIEDMRSRLEAATRPETPVPEGPESAPELKPDTPAADLARTDSPFLPEKEKRRTRVGLWAGVITGVAVVAGAVTVVLAVALRPHIGNRTAEGYPGEVFDLRNTAF